MGVWNGGIFEIGGIYFNMGKLLTETKIRSLKPKDKQYKVFDSGGLFLIITPKGSKLWRYKYRFSGKEKSLSIGQYPIFSLAEARELRDKAKKQLALGNDPSALKKAEKLKNEAAHKNTFEAVAREWHEKRKGEWTHKHGLEVLHSLERDVFPYVGHRPIEEITPPELLKVLRKIENRGALVMVTKLRQRCDAIFKYAIITGRATYNAAIDLQGAFKSHKKSNYRALQRKQIPEFMDALDACTSDRTLVCAIKFIFYTLARTNEVRFARWDEVNWEEKLWEVPESRMKASRSHIVPLSSQAFSILEELREINGAYPFIFASYHKPHKQPFSENGLLSVLKRIDMLKFTTVHGLRATASTILNEMGYNPDWIERALAHVPSNKVRAAYNRAEYLNDRANMLQEWADYIDKGSINVIPINSNAKKK